MTKARERTPAAVQYAFWEDALGLGFFFIPGNTPQGGSQS